MALELGCSVSDSTSSTMPVTVPSLGPSTKGVPSRLGRISPRRWLGSGRHLRYLNSNAGPGNPSARASSRSSQLRHAKPCALGPSALRPPLPGIRSTMYAPRSRDGCSIWSRGAPQRSHPVIMMPVRCDSSLSASRNSCTRWVPEWLGRQFTSAEHHESHLVHIGGAKHATNVLRLARPVQRDRCECFPHRCRLPVVRTRVMGCSPAS